MSGKYMETMLKHYGEKEAIEEKQRVLDLSLGHMLEILRNNIIVPVTVGNTEFCIDLGENNMLRIANKLIEEGYLLEQHSCWATDDEGNLICNNCHGKALSNPDAPDEIILSNYCPHCGSNMKG